MRGRVSYQEKYIIGWNKYQIASSKGKPLPTFDLKINTPGTAGGPGGRDRTLAVMPKYWGKQIFTHGRFPEVGQKQKTERKEREKERKTERW